jgi:asparagine N-glycosylation enzyme membrane subunit Stt3
MAASMGPVAAGTALWVGALIGLLTVIAIYFANYLINGRLPT